MRHFSCFSNTIATFISRCFLFSHYMVHSVAISAVSFLFRSYILSSHYSDHISCHHIILAITLFRSYILSSHYSCHHIILVITLFLSSHYSCHHIILVITLFLSSHYSDHISCHRMHAVVIVYWEINVPGNFRFFHWVSAGHYTSVQRIHLFVYDLILAVLCIHKRF